MTRAAQLHWQQFELVFELDPATQTQLRILGDWAVPRMSLQLGPDEGARFAVPQALCEAMRDRGFNGMRARRAGLAASAAAARLARAQRLAKRAPADPALGWQLHADRGNVCALRGIRCCGGKIWR